MVDIPRSTLEEMFDDMRRHYDWNVDGPLLWGYFFVGKSKSELERAAARLLPGGYSLVDVYLQEKDSPEDEDQWWLHVEQVEHHTVDSLVERNLHLNAFADANGLVCYDGMDVGPTPAS
jgi:hypothetical protein